MKNYVSAGGAVLLAALLVGPCFGQSAENLARWRAELQSKDAATRKHAAKQLGALGARARPAVPDLVAALGQEKDLSVYGEVALALARAGALERLQGERKALQRYVELLGEQNEKLSKDAKDLDNLAKEAMKSTGPPGMRSPPMLSSALLFRQQAQEARRLIGENLRRRGEARLQLVAVEAALRRVGR